MEIFTKNLHNKGRKDLDCEHATENTNFDC